MEKKIIFSIIGIIVVAAVVFLSQQAYFRGIGKNIFLQGANVAQDYLTKGSNWAKDSVYPKISGEVQKRGDIIKNEINAEKEKISETIGEKIKSYFSGVADSIFHPGKAKQNQACPPTEPSQMPPSQ